MAPEGPLDPGGARAAVHAADGQLEGLELVLVVGLSGTGDAGDPEVARHGQVVSNTVAS